MHATGVKHESCTRCCGAHRADLDSRWTVRKDLARHSQPDHGEGRQEVHCPFNILGRIRTEQGPKLAAGFLTAPLSLFLDVPRLRRVTAVVQ
jgi:hypothetical protein